VIQADEVLLSFAHGGRIAVISVAEGDLVTAGQELVVLDTAMLEAQVVLAEAQLAVAQSALRQWEAGARPGAIAAAEARLAQAQAGYAAAQQALSDARAMRENPQDLQMQVDVGELRLQAADYRVRSAVALKDAAEVVKDQAGFVEEQIRNWSYPVAAPAMPQELRPAAYDWWRAWVGVNAATASLEDAKAQLRHWKVTLSNPQELDAQLAMSEAEVARAAAAVDVAQAQLDSFRAGATEAQLVVAHARVAQAQAASDGLRAEREEMALVAPVDGVVLSRMAHAGEVVVPGGGVLSLADLSSVKLRVYIPENRLGEVALGQQVAVRVDAIPGRVLQGQVLHVADTAEYTPRNVATKEERVNTVYAVEILLTNEEGLLKAGMSADAEFMR
jgi:HlyD family secretion protein